MVFRVKFDAEIMASRAVRCKACGAGPGKGVQHEITGFRESLDQRFQDVDSRKLRGKEGP